LFALVHGQLNRPACAPFHAFAILFQDAKSIDGMRFFGNFDNCVAAIEECKNDWASVSPVSEPPGEDANWPALRLPP